MSAGYPLCRLGQTGLEVEPAQLRDLFLAFAKSVDSASGAWRRDLWRRRRRILKRLVRQRLAGRAEDGREAGAVLEEYDKAWSGIDYEIYDPDYRGWKPTPWQFGQECFHASDLGATRFRQLLLIRVIETLKPRRVLEVGCGNGINLLLAAGRFPSIEFSGLELTEAGVGAAQAFQSGHETLPEPMQRYAPEALQDPTAFRRIEFVQGNAVAMPFDDGQFDLVYSMLALEQMEAVRKAALAEVGRVCGGAYFGVEPFREANDRGWRRLYVKQRGYFAAPVTDLSTVGLEPQWATMNFPQEVFLGSCAVLAHRR